MKFILFALIAGASAFSVTFDKTKAHQIVGGWGSSFGPFMEWSQQQDRETMQQAQPYLQEMDKNLQELARLSKEANVEFFQKLNETAKQAMAESLVHMGCETDTDGQEWSKNVTYMSRDCNVCEPQGKCYWDESRCKYEERSWEYRTTKRCSDPVWFLEKLDRKPYGNSLYICNC